VDARENGRERTDGKAKLEVVLASQQLEIGDTSTALYERGQLRIHGNTLCHVRILLDD